MDECRLNLCYFEELLSRINRRLAELRPPDWEDQVKDYPWLYGALGSVPASVMFICENPSLKPMRSAHTIDGRRPDIEAQWWGGENNPAAKRFRFVLHKSGLKTTPPSARAGWNCYITNVVKEANLASDQGARNSVSRNEQARRWSDILAWELSEVDPEHVFCVGGRSARAIKMLQREKHLPSFPVHKIWHYSARREDRLVREHMLDGILAVLRA
ncbi:MAG: uracil-DNA glycosylase family protein [Planctomycetota bacterium]|nr:uracil-DNA glycosylase family protein [Planctomycetota bacterium]